MSSKLDLNSQLQDQQSLSFLTFAQKILQRHGRSLIGLFMGVVLPLALFEQLALVVRQNQQSFPWDEPILLKLHALEQPDLTKLAAGLTRLGGFKSVTIITSALSVILLVRQRWRSLLYFVITLFGTGLMNRTAKELLHRARPRLWESAAPEFDFSFPSGHATASMTLIVALAILTWGSRWFWLVVVGGGGYVIAIAWTRLYLGVHFPSDILGAWLISISWAIGVGLVIRPHLSQTHIFAETHSTKEEESSQTVN
ncbi:MAG: phosphatase PAP2 family protein [Nodosilinea sp.]